jgi:hypothetical protein
MTAGNHDSILNSATPQEAAHLLTTLDSGQRAAYEAARQAEGTSAWGPAISTAAEVHHHWIQAMDESCQLGMRQPAEPLPDFAARVWRRGEPAAEAKNPPGRDPSPPPKTRPPEYLVEAWVSEQLKEKIRRLDAAPGRSRGAEHRRAPEPDLEAEP